MDAIEKGTYATNYEQQLEEGVVQDMAQFMESIGQLPMKEWL